MVKGFKNKKGQFIPVGMAHENVPINERLIPMGKDWKNLNDLDKAHFTVGLNDEGQDHLTGLGLQGQSTYDVFDENGKRLRINSPEWFARDSTAYNKRYGGNVSFENSPTENIKYFRLNKAGHEKIAFLNDPRTIQARKKARAWDRQRR